MKNFQIGLLYLVLEMNIDYFICLSNTDLDDWTGYKKQILVHLFSTYIRIKMNTDSYITSFSGSNNSSSQTSISISARETLVLRM